MSPPRHSKLDWILSLVYLVFFFFLSVDKLHIEPESIDRSLEFAGLVLDVVLGRPFLSSARSSRERDVSD